MINKRTLVCKEVSKDFSLFLKVFQVFICAKAGIQGKFLLFRKVFNIDQYAKSDFFYCLIVYILYQIGVDNSFAWIPQ